jgi:hypothetical protein
MLALKLLIPWNADEFTYIAFFVGINR